MRSILEEIDVLQEEKKLHPENNYCEMYGCIRPPVYKIVSKHGSGVGDKDILCVCEECEALLKDEAKRYAYAYSVPVIIDPSFIPTKKRKYTQRKTEVDGLEDVIEDEDIILVSEYDARNY